MDFRSPIRRCLDIALIVLSAAAVAVGGSAALSGAGLFAASLLPGMAQARQPAGDSVRLTIAGPIAASRYAPQVLFPVTASPFPRWMQMAPQTPLTRFTPPATVNYPMLVRRPAAARPAIAICIDDLGEDLAGTDRAMALPQPVALSFLSFAEATPFLAGEAERKGHTVLAHVPMQPLGRINPGPMALMTGMTQAEIARRIAWNIARVPGLAGINNHEGSRFTADVVGLAPVVAALKARHLFFFDSRTGPNSRIAAVAHAAGVQTAGRDIFLDDDPRPAAIKMQLALLVATADRNGVAIAIGHPHDTTLTTLAAWLTKDHGVTLVPLEDAMQLKQAREAALAAR
jgi:hypothetical protein